nr:MAG TPA: hypothetical protein [Caudoviricetes sp.]
MTELSKIQALVDEELKEANEKYPLFHSYHEAYAVILEELEETEENVKAMGYCIQAMWDYVKRDKEPRKSVENLKNFALNTAAEAIQVAAMCDKVLLKEEQETFLHGWIKCKDPSELTPENICRFCVASPDECGEYPDICYKGVMRESK